MNYDEIELELSKKRWESRLVSLYIYDKSLMFEDIVSDLYIYCIENSIRCLDYDFLNDYFKDYSREKRKNKSYPLFENSLCNSEYAEDIDDCIDDKYYINKFKKINLSDEEILCLLYSQNKNNIKKYNYDFILRNNKRGVDFNKLNKCYKSIIDKLLTHIRKED